MDDDPWKELGELIALRRETLPLSRRAADRASGVKEPTWRRLESGLGVTGPNLYRMLSALQFTEAEAELAFERVGLDFDAAKYEQPEAVAQLRSALSAIKRSAEEAEVALARIEGEIRGR